MVAKTCRILDFGRRTVHGDGTTQACTFLMSRLEELLASRHLLRDHAGGGNHGEAAVVELLGLHFLELLRILGLQAEWVEAQVSWLVVFFHRPLLAGGWILKGEDRIDLRDGNRSHDCGPEVLARSLLESQVRWHVYVTAEQRVKL